MGLTPSPHAPDDLHWTEGDIESIDVDGRSVSVVARKVFVLGALGPRRTWVTFLGVSSATLKVTEYMEPPQGPEYFKAPYGIYRRDLQGEKGGGMQTRCEVTKMV
jgi:hypothetical protein